MDELLRDQLEMYERGDLSALEQILTSTMSQLPQDDGEITIVSEAVSFTPSVNTNTTLNSQKDDVGKLDLSLNTDTSTMAGSESSVSTQGEGNYSNSPYPALTVQIREEISNVAKEYIRLDEALTRIRRMKKEFEKEKGTKDQKLLEYIERYGLKDITKGKHQLVPRVRKGSKKGYNRKLIQEKLSDFLSTLDIINDVEVEEIAMQATDYLDNTRGTREDSLRLQHQRL